MRVLIDTNAYTALLAGDRRIADELAKSEAVLLSGIVIGELYEGFRGGGRDRENREILGRFKAKPLSKSSLIGPARRLFMFRP